METIATIGAAFLGGMILNIMPCVLPVLTLKVYHVIETAGHRERNGALDALAYTAGTVSVFMLLAGVVIALNTAGEGTAWGRHFQYPPFVAGLTAVVFAFSLNALGLYELRVSTQRGNDHGGYLGTAVNGVFLAIMSTPCTAPFLGPAMLLAFAADTPTWLTITLFGAVGVGLAFPFAAISVIPGAARLLPRPGAWMVTFKQLMGFTLMGVAVWLLSVLQKQLTADSFGWFLFFLLGLAMALWAIETFGGLQHGLRRRIGVRVAVVATVAIGIVELPLDRATVEFAQAAQPEVAYAAVVDDRINWVDFNPERIASEHKAGRAVFADYTADWCAACKTNEQVFLETDTVRQALVATNIVPVKVDMTIENDIMDEWLERLDRTGIPAYVIYMPDGSFDLLPVTITADMVADRLHKAAAALRGS